jgi:hypothetical protein
MDCCGAAQPHSGRQVILLAVFVIAAAALIAIVATGLLINYPK